MVKAGVKLKAGQQVIIRPPKKLNPLQKVDNPPQVRPGFKIDDVRYKPRLPYVEEYFEDQNDDNTLDNVASICNSSSRIN
ncbi:hypothetical protein GCK72_008580 [Caenorhabditis remanei]|uniref:Uncharacterized protein n=1 Tax=Caenorhabditis remanei TaxID=31234 RepID=A0A6A5H025_CAERE|nr:hypothetical protein GCK72_008580 [Caenorhabditis remanei]KAF1760331.1 hypothetical protein GCK72_008580 [Caenorhabditis remanei]